MEKTHTEKLLFPHLSERLSGLDRNAFFQLGIHPEKPEHGFNMTALALRPSGCRNAVSRRHVQVSQQMWQSLWPGIPVKRLLQDLINLACDLQIWGRI